MSNGHGGGMASIEVKEETLVEQFAKWIADETKSGKVLSKLQLAKMISRLKSGAQVTESQTLSWVSNARRYCEKNLLCTIINIPGDGWRVTKKGSGEIELYFCKSIKKTIAWADRTMDLQAISERRLMPGAIKQVFYDAEGNIKRLSAKRQRILETWTNFTNAQKERLKLDETSSVKDR